MRILDQIHHQRVKRGGIRQIMDCEVLLPLLECTIRNSNLLPQYHQCSERQDVEIDEMWD